MHKYVKIKKHTSEQPMGQRKNQQGNQTISWNKQKWKHNTAKPMGYSKSSSKREVYSYTSLPQETRKISNEKSNLTPKGTRERWTNKTQN